MNASIVEDPSLRNRTWVYQDREEAGAYLAGFLEEHRGKEAIVLAIPSGGVPVGLAVSTNLDLPFDLLIARKIPIPGNPEAGFGALSLEGELVLNPFLVGTLSLSADEIEELARPVREELERRNSLFRQGRPWPEMKGREAIIVDDGLASGYTMMAAVRNVWKREPEKIVVAVPTASASTVKLLSTEVEVIVCPNIRSGYSFAVADAYRRWRDLTEVEVMSMLQRWEARADDQWEVKGKS
jgi:predicted phosphoribosyltransferase